jgi:hypothetical protein
MTRWEKERLTEQLKFFGAKKTRFISCYAKKPRILIGRPKVNSERLIIGGQVFNGAASEARRSALYQQQMQLGIQHSALGFNQMAAMQQSRDSQLQAMSMTANQGLCGMSNGADARAMGQQNTYIPYLGGWCG